MSYHRITVSLPEIVYERLLECVSGRGVSKFVSEAVQEKIVAEQKKISPFDAFQKSITEDRIPDATTEDIIKTIQKGRL